jgi:hypothetical protein
VFDLKKKKGTRNRKEEKIEKKEGLGLWISLVSASSRWL